MVIAGGGTGGHAFPALALARELLERDAAGTPALVRLVGTRRGPEGKAAELAGIPFEGLDVVGFRRSLAPVNALAGAKAVGACLRALGILRRAQADVAVGTGAYASIPVVLAARLRRTPLVIHEQNAIPGRANRLAGRWAAAVAVSFPETQRWFPKPVVVTGNPIRSEIAHLDKAALRPAALDYFGLQPGRRTLLVFGGSQGARRINEAALGGYERWHDREQLQVLHLVGPKELLTAQARLAELTQDGDRLLWRLVGFTDRMDLAYAVADLAVCRAGAATVFEIAAARLPAIVIPYPYAGDHQRHNAQALVESKAVRLLSDEGCTAIALGDVVDSVLFDPAELAAMAESLASFARPTAAKNLADLVFRVGRQP